MGFADMLILLGIPYDSNEAVEVAEEVMAFINSRSKEKSAELAVAKGAFPFYRDSTYAGEGTQLRNATTTTIAPTGTISIIAGASSGIEPLFAISFIRNVMDKDQLPEVHPIFEETARKRGFYSRALMEEISRKGTIKDIKGVPEDVKRLFVTAHDISPEWHIRMQAAFQKHTDNAVSKTVNFPSHAVREDVRKVYLLAHKLGCKGVTIYRDKSREEQVLSIGGPEGEAETGHDVKGQTITPRIRPEITRGLTEKVKIGCGNLYITVNYDDNGICEVFTNLGRAGGCPSQSEATSRLISIALRSGISVEAIIEQLKGIRCHSTIRQRANGSGIKVLSCPDAIGKTIERAMKMNRSAGAVVKEGLPAEGTPLRDGVKAACPECGGMLEHESGCVVCPNCGFSRCG
jgi:ribonucleoside-diphosphate reductase alpha chain